MHVTPPMGPLNVMKGQPISDPAGWVDVSKTTLQHNRYSNIFGIGDCTNVPTSRTAAACAAESAVLMQNLVSVMRGETLLSHVSYTAVVTYNVVLYKKYYFFCIVVRWLYLMPSYHWLWQDYTS